MIKLFNFLAFTAVSLGVMGASLTSPTGKPSPKPNIVFFLVDDMGWIDCGVYGSEYYETPNIDRLATQSVRFAQAYAHPGCSPTRASLLTGQTAARHGITTAWGHMPTQPRPAVLPRSRTFLDPSQYTVANALRDAGYRTAHLGKWHLGLNQENWPETMGFDVSWHCAPDAGPPSYFSPYGVKPEGQPAGRNFVGNITDGPDGEYITDRITDEAIQFMAENKDRPFLLHLWHYGIHGPWWAKEDHIKKFIGKTDPRGVQGNPIVAAMLLSIDESLGRILEELDRLGIADNTIFIFASDNGGLAKPLKKGHIMLKEWEKWGLAPDMPVTSNLPLRDGKQSPYEGGIRVPLIIRWPGHAPAGTVSNAMVGVMDYYPTMLELLGLPSPKNQKIDGISFANVLLNPAAQMPDRTYIMYYVKSVAAICGDWKLIRFHDDGKKELYNLRQDIEEINNLAASNPGKVKELEAAIAKHLEDVKAGH